MPKSDIARALAAAQDYLFSLVANPLGGGRSTVYRCLSGSTTA